MKIYFVRHGESVQTDKVHQSAETPLSDVGKQQVARVIQKLADIPVDAIISSPYIRAVQSATEIERAKNITTILSDLFIERKMPSLFIGKPVKDPQIATIHQQIRENFYNPHWHNSDEENFIDMLTRAKKALEFIVSQQKENIVVVTHGYFLSVLMFDIILGDFESSKFFRPFRKHTEFSNGGITTCEYKDDTWKVLTMNEM